MLTNEKKTAKKAATKETTSKKTSAKKATKKTVKSKNSGHLTIQYKARDEYYTPRILVEPIIEYIPKGATVWCPFDTENSEFVHVLKEHGYKVIHSHLWDGKDFFEYTPAEHYDCIISNPPFSLKMDVFKRLFELGKPFAILMNSSAEQYQCVGSLFYEMAQQGKYIQKLNPDKKVSFNGKGSSFNTAYFCWKFLPFDYIMCHLEHNNSGKHYVPSRMYEDATNNFESIA